MNKTFPLLLALLLIACSAAEPQATRVALIPSVQPVFRNDPTPTTISLRPSPAPSSTAAPRPADNLIERAIFDETLDPAWSLEHSLGMDYQIVASEFAHQGSSSIELTPGEDYGQLFFTVRPETDLVFQRNRVVGLSIWLYTAEVEVDPGSLAICIVGSNARPFWQPEDDSVQLDEQHFFSETRLYYLGINRPIPPQTWIELLVWLDDLPYEPDYRYITGVYVKNDAGMRQTVYLDQLVLLMSEEV